MWNLKYDTNEPIYRTETDSYTDWWLPRGRVVGEEWTGVNRCKLLHLEWINNKFLLYNRGTYIQYAELNHTGKYKKKECVCVCVYIYLNQFAI